MTANRPRFEVADVVRMCKDEYRFMHGLTASQERILKDIVQCRTAQMGGHRNKVHRCTSCGHEQQAYNSCRNRHCPKCQGPRSAEWLAERMQHVLPIEYYHVVFTLPDLLNPLVLGNKRVMYNMLFSAASQSIQELASDPKYLAAQVGLTSVLHSWGQNLAFHPHLHCVVTGGGLSKDGDSWIASRPGFFLPVRVISDLFRGKFLAALQKAYDDKKLHFGGSVSSLEDPMIFGNLRDRLYNIRWVVYTKRPFAGPRQVFQYLGRYTHRVAISNTRIISVTNQQVSFLYRDYKDDAHQKVMTLKPEEFLRRFLLHELPKRFVRIRHYGLSASPNVKTKLAKAKLLLNVDTTEFQEQEAKDWWEQLMALTGVDVMKCPKCGGQMLELDACLQKSTEPKIPRAPPHD